MKRLTTEDFIQKAKIVHGDKYDYHLVEYDGNKKKIKIICKEHGEFFQTPDNHCAGNGCPLHKGKKKFTTEEFINKAKEVHGDRYDYSKVKYNGCFNKVIIICKEHGDFIQTADAHLAKCGCQMCSISLGESKIIRFLNENKINFITQKRFLDCRNKQPLPFDFYLPQYNTCIEYDGEQHFKPVLHMRGLVINRKESINRYKKIQLHDKIKDKYCKDNGIRLIRIPYTKIKEIEIILGEELNEI